MSKSIVTTKVEQRATEAQESRLQSLSVLVDLPPVALSPNARLHPAKMGVARGRYRRDCYYLMHQAWGRLAPASEVVTVHLDCYPGERKRDGLYRPTDRDNLVAATVPLRNALKDIGLVTDDSADYVRLGRCEIHRDGGLFAPGIVVGLEYQS